METRHKIKFLMRQITLTTLEQNVASFELWHWISFFLFLSSDCSSSVPLMAIVWMKKNFNNSIFSWIEKELWIDGNKSRFNLIELQQYAFYFHEISIHFSFIVRCLDNIKELRKKIQGFFIILRHFLLASIKSRINNCGMYCWIF